MGESISIREFARRSNVSDTLVHFALKEGRLSKLPDGRMDSALVGTPWRASAKPANEGANPALQAGGTKGVTYGEALRLKENWVAMLRQIEYSVKAGSLIELTHAQDVLFEAFRAQRDAWLNWPVRAAPQIAVELGIEDIELLTNVLTAHVHTQLSALGEPSGDGFTQRPLAP